MSAPLYQLVYISRATRPLDNRELDELGKKAAHFNDLQGLSGLLLHDGHRFIQALEGQRDAVEALMERIERDPRHDSIAYVERGSVTARQFGGWAMDVRRVRDTRGAQGFLADLKRTLASVEDHRLVAAFIGFAMLGRPELRANRTAPPADQRT